MRKKRKVIDPVEEVLIQIKQIGQQSTSEIDEDLSFGQMAAMNLTMLIPQQKAQAKIRMQQLKLSLRHPSLIIKVVYCHHTTHLIMLTTIPVIKTCQAMTSKINLL